MGNLYTTLVIETGVSAAVATQLSFVAALAAHEAVAAHLPAEQLPRFRLKWPNDVMLGAAKLAGILLESLTPPKGKKLAVILGVGINIAHAPADTERAATSLGLAAAAVAGFLLRLRQRSRYGSPGGTRAAAFRPSAKPGLPVRLR